MALILVMDSALVTLIAGNKGEVVKVETHL